MAVPDGVSGSRATDISESIEQVIREGRLESGAQLPTVRALADHLSVSRSTVSAAYRYLRQRGVISTHGRNGTRVHRRPLVDISAARSVDDALRNVGVPPTGTELAQINRDALIALVDDRDLADDGQLEQHLAKHLDADGVDATALVAVGSAQEALARILESHLLPGDRVGIEAPSSSDITGVLALEDLQPVGLRLDDEGVTPSALEGSLPRLKAVILSPRAQDPTGTSISGDRARRLRQLLGQRPDMVVIEWDARGDLAGVPYVGVVRATMERWAHVRSFAGVFAQQADLAAVAGDPVTVSRVRVQQMLGGTGVTPLLRQIANNVFEHPGTPYRTDAHARHLGSRRALVTTALRHRGIASIGQSGPFVWIPTDDQNLVVDAMAERGWLLIGGERPEPTTEQGVRVAVEHFDPMLSGHFADDLLEVLAEI